MEVFKNVIMVFEYVIFGYFTISSLYILIFAVAGNFYRRRSPKSSQKIFNKIAVFIPAYKEDAVIVEVAKSALKNNYPLTKFDIVVIADSLEAKTISKLKELPIILVEVSFQQSTKAKALNRAMEVISQNYDYAIILDADNIMEADFLNKMNQAFNDGHLIVQGHRKAKNLNTSYAMLDAASEEINNHIFRNGHRALGLSSALIGSGIGFEYDLFKAEMATMKVVGGFDKELEFRLALKGNKVEYLPDAIVLDEKIQRPGDFSNQRKRWLSTQFIFLSKYFIKGIKELLLRGNINFFDKLFQMIVPPRILLLGNTFIITFIYVIFVFGFRYNPNVALHYWILNCIIVVAALLLALPKSFYNTKTLLAIVWLPSAFLRMKFLLFKLKGADENFIHTAHGVMENE